MKDKWLDQAVIYQINLRSLCCREPRNPIEALLEKEQADSAFQYLNDNLEVLKTLGVTTLHIMPPFVMGMAERKGIGSPYAARDYKSVDPEYGTIAEFKAFIARAHELDFKVILGMVPNHTSRDNVWIDSNPEFYVQNDQGNIIYDLDWSDTAKLDYTNAGLRQAMHDVYDYWLGILGGNDGVDGFRIDMAHFINDRTFWNDAIPALREKYAQRELLFLAECYGIDNSMDLFERGFNGSYDDAFYKLLEHYYGTDHDGNSILFSPTFHAANTCHSPQFTVFNEAGYAGAVKALLSEYEEQLPKVKHPVYLARYTDNHDEGRGIYRFGLQAVKAMNTLLFFSNHCIPFLLTGQEFGAANRPSIHNRFGLCDKGRNQITDTDIRHVEGIEFEGNSFIRTFSERQDLLRFYKQLITLRLSTPCLQHGTFRWVNLQEQGHPGEHTLVAFEREFQGTILRGVVNLGHQARSYASTEWMKGSILYGTQPNGTTIDAFSAVLFIDRSA